MEYLDIHTHSSIQRKGVYSIQSISLSTSFNLPIDQPISVGLHPWHADLANLSAQMVVLEKLAKTENVMMIGECGLDKLRGEKLSNQLEILTAQIGLAEQVKKPLILHCVRAFNELMDLKLTLNVKVPMIIHGFNKNPILALQLIDKGFYISLGKAILNPNSGAAKLVKQTNCFFLETDEADITIEELYVAVANLKNSSVDELKARIFASWEKLF